MPRRLLFIEASSPFQDDIVGQLQDAADDACERIGWASVEDPSRLCGCEADLVVPVAVRAGAEAKALFHWLREHPIARPVVAVLPENASDIVQLASEVVDDFVLWPVRLDEWRQRIARILGPLGDADAGRERLVQEMGIAQLIGRDPAFLAVVRQIPRLARADRPVLITGETGTGKELCARAIHHLSRRHSLPFIPVDCAAFPDHLFENELFGHVRGAFTDAHTKQRGLVAMAEGGTLFLDEIDSLSFAAQAKLLRFIQERSYKPLGADRFVAADVNLLAATNRNLEELTREQRFRIDLYFRLNVLELHLLPLRVRRGDIEILARHFVETSHAPDGVRKTLAPATLRKLTAYDWPGNVRELLNTIQRAVVLAEGAQILPCHATVGPPDPPGVPPEEPWGFRQARTRALEAFERGYIEGLLRKHRGNVTRAARDAQKDRRAFGRLMKKYRIDRSALFYS